MIKSASLSLLLLLQFIVVSAQSPVPKVAPEIQGFSIERLARLDTNINRWIKNEWMNGAMVLITRNGKTVYEKAFGYDNPVQKTPLKKGMLYRLASQTKAITSVGIMLLYEEGKLLPDDPISKFIPSFANQKVLDKFVDADSSYTEKPTKRPVTIRDLLSHTSGIDYAQIGSTPGRSIFAKNNITAGLGLTSEHSLATDMSKVGTLPLMHQPGERFTYGLNTDILGYVIEVVSGMSLDRFLKTRIFDPLGMTDTHFNLPPEKHNRLTTLVMETNKGLEIMPPVFTFAGVDMAPDYPKRGNTYFAGGAGLTATINDYDKFLQMLLNGGYYNGRQLLAPSTVRMMTSNQIGNLNLGTGKFGLGFSIATKETANQYPQSEGTFGWGGIFGTAYWVDPKEKLTIQIYTQVWNRKHNPDEQFLGLVYQALLK